MSAPVSSEILRRIAALRLQPEAMAEVLSIVADVQAVDERRRETQRTRKQKQRDRRGTGAGQRRDIADATQTVVPLCDEPTLDLVSSSTGDSSEIENPASLSLSSSEDSCLGSRDSGDTRARDGKRRATRLPEGWLPTPDGLDFARSWMQPDFIQIEIDKFRDYWRAANGPPSVKRDWSAAWRNWCRKSPQFNRGQNGQHRQGGRNGSAITTAINDHIANFERAARGDGEDCEGTPRLV